MTARTQDTHRIGGSLGAAASASARLTGPPQVESLDLRGTGRQIPSSGGEGENRLGGGRGGGVGGGRWWRRREAGEAGGGGRRPGRRREVGEAGGGGGGRGGGGRPGRRRA
ncbi:hypothetical protein GUJ93_ZPchr0006g40700 [Zizania palustris]|uniref:Uncharacterized protein n=1 Tax=Zizania palustris TaxID=103762 RepID=A0A8J5SXG9_ZIZPA|nr:hypothetical protein GUJ93_ZPchr0006g40700 [Zizania palustris]